MESKQSSALGQVMLNNSNCSRYTFFISHGIS